MYLTTNLFVKDMQPLDNIVYIFRVHSKILSPKTSLTKFSLAGIGVLKRV